MQNDWEYVLCMLAPAFPMVILFILILIGYEYIHSNEYWDGEHWRTK